MHYKKNSLGDTYEVGENTYSKAEAIRRFVDEQGYLNADQISEIIGIHPTNVRTRLNNYKTLSTLNFVEVDGYDLQNNCKPEYSHTSSIQDLKLRAKEHNVLQCLDNTKTKSAITSEFDSQNNETKVKSVITSEFDSQNSEAKAKSDSTSRYNTKVSFDKAVIHTVTSDRQGNKKGVTYYSSNILDWFWIDFPKAAPREDRFKLFSAIFLKLSLLKNKVKSLQHKLAQTENEKYISFHKGVDAGTASMQYQLEEEKRIKSKHYQRAKKLSAENKALKQAHKEIKELQTQISDKDEELKKLRVKEKWIEDELVPSLLRLLKCPGDCEKEFWDGYKEKCENIIKY